MVRRASIEFVPANTPITSLVTKFGGQPVWFAEPQWPVSRSTGQPMQFIGQIASNSELFGDLPFRMAYLFMTDDSHEYVDGTWEPDSGENALILQPGVPSVPTAPLTSGPALYAMQPIPGQQRLQPVPVEYALEYQWPDDPDFVDEVELGTWEIERLEARSAMLSGNKLGGTPGFLQAEEFPGPGHWRLLLQLDATQVPFSVNFGDGGIGYAFVSEDGQTGKFLWQCS